MMEELLLPTGEEEARSENSSYAPGEKEEKTMGEHFKSFFLETIAVDLRRSVHNFLKRNGLLTLSVLAVLTGCVLGFVLRGSQLSIQVGRHRTIALSVLGRKTQNHNSVSHVLAVSMVCLIGPHVCIYQDTKLTLIPKKRYVRISISCKTFCWRSRMRKV